MRLQSENSQLHVLVMQQAERQERQAREHYQARKRLEDTIADLSYWKNVAAEKLVAADRENGALRRRSEELQHLIDKLTAGGACCGGALPELLTQACSCAKQVSVPCAGTATAPSVVAKVTATSPIGARCISFASLTTAFARELMLPCALPSLPMRLPTQAHCSSHPRPTSRRALLSMCCRPRTTGAL